MVFADFPTNKANFYRINRLKFLLESTIIYKTFFSPVKKNISRDGGIAESFDVPEDTR